MKKLATFILVLITLSGVVVGLGALDWLVLGNGPVTQRALSKCRSINEKSEVPDNSRFLEYGYRPATKAEVRKYCRKSYLDGDLNLRGGGAVFPNYGE